MSRASCSRVLPVTIVALCAAVAWSGPLVTTSGLTADQLAAALTASGSGVVISNAVLTGSDRAAGSFVGGTGIVGFESGIILGSGGISGAVGPNTSDGLSDDLLLPGDADLDGLIPGYATNDATVLEFDFVPLGAQIRFRYVFTSEEYNEWVNSSFNDVFGFFVNGVNYARLPDGVTPVSINNVNNGNPYGSGGTNSAFYINNDLSDGGGAIDIQSDGLTVVLTLRAPVIDGATNHMKLAIADAGDHILDSWVFVEGGSFAVDEICDNGLDDDFDDLIDNGDPDCHVCGDGDVDPGEACDDGNIENGDGCSALCEIEIINQTPTCFAAYASPANFWAPNHKLAPVEILGVTDPDGDLVVITVDSIFQDEAVRGKGSGNTSPDGRIFPLAVRAEREGGGDGRTYHIGFTATDGLNSCSGTVRVCVPHDQRPGGGCVDGGPLFDSTQP